MDTLSASFCEGLIKPMAGKQLHGVKKENPCWGVAFDDFLCI